MRRIFRMILLVVALVSGLLPVRAQDDVERARANAQAWLLKEISKPNLVLVQYTYQGSAWNDTAMGCPAPGQTVTPGLVNGYIWTFLFDNQVRYEVHSSMDGTQAVLCSSRSEAPEMQLSIYTSPLFTLLVPEAWLIYPNSDGTQVLFASQQEVTCATPGMRVTSMGRVASGVTPDNLIDDYLTNAGLQDDPAARLTVGSFGRTAALQAPCDAGTRDWWISGFVQYGDGYIVEQWSPTDQTAELGPLFGEMVAPFGPPGSTEIAPPATDTANGSETNGEAAAPAPLAPLPLAHLFVGDVFLGQLDDIPGRSVTSVPTQERRYLAFSPNGLFLSYIDTTDNQLRLLDVTNGVSPRKIAEEVSPLFPPAWNADNGRIAFVAPTGQDDPNGMPIMELRSVSVQGGDPVVLGSFVWAGDCSTPFSDPADKPYFAEAGPDHVLVWLSNDQFLISLRCEGGLALFNPAGGGITVLGTDLLGGALSPDGQRFVARGVNGLAILDLPGGQRTDLGKGAGARAVAWSQDGQAIYYSTESEANRVTLDDPGAADRGEAVFGFWPVTVTTCNLSLVRLDLNGSAESTLWQGQGRGVGRIAPAPDGSGVLFTVVPTGQTLVEVFQAGGDPLSVREAWPVSALYWLEAGGTVPRLLAYAGSPVFAPITITPPAPVAENN